MVVVGLKVASLNLDYVAASLDFSTHVCRNTQPNTLYKMPVIVICVSCDCHVTSNNYNQIDQG